MPTYEYACSACGNEWEKEQRISEAPVRKCPKCGKSKAQRLISGGNFILKGDGWYADLYSKPPKKKATEASETTTEAPASDAKTEAKPEKKKTKKKKASSDAA